MITQDELIAVGKIVGAHGIRGSLKVKSFCDDPAIFDTSYPLRVKVYQQNIISYRINTHRAHGRSLLIDLKGINTREQAQRLIGAELLLPRSAFPDPEEGSYYWFELIGFDVRTIDGKFLGSVYRLLSTGPHDILVVRNSDSEILIPMVESFVKTIEKVRKTICVDVPDDMPIEKLEPKAHSLKDASCIS